MRTLKERGKMKRFLCAEGVKKLKIREPNERFPESGTKIQGIRYRSILFSELNFFNEQYRSLQK